MMVIKFDIKDDGELDKVIKEAQDNAENFLIDVADEIFAESQKMVSQRAFDKGTLMKSGNMLFYGKGIILIGYNTTYARPVHDGFQAQEVTVMSHSRRTRGGGSSKVREHKRLIPEREATNYLDDAIKRVMSRLPKESQDMIKIERFRSDLLG